METIELNWEGPFTFESLLKPGCKSDDPEHPRRKYNCAGVYIWETGDEENGDREVHYVGKATGSPSLWLRQCDHYIYQIGGRYLIPAEFTSNSKEWRCDFKDPEVIETLFDEIAFKKVVSDGFNYSKLIRIYFAKIDPGKVGVVERNLLYDLRPPYTKPGTKSEPKDRVKILHHGMFQPPQKKNEG
jgi:hypothetical protein